MNAAGKKLEKYQELVAISYGFSSTLDLDNLVYLILQGGMRITETTTGVLFLFDHQDQQLHYQIATNLDHLFSPGAVVPLDSSVAGWIYSHRVPYQITHADNRPHNLNFIEVAANQKIRDLLGVPLLHKEKIVGVLEVMNKPGGVFTKLDEEMLMILSTQAAVSIENLRLFQQSDLISEFVHEIRTPLAAISTATYLLQRQQITPEARDQIVQNIHLETQRLSALATSFHELAKLESGRAHFTFTVIDVMELFDECVAQVQTKADEKHIQIIIQDPVDILPFRGDREKIKQVILNLLSNAIKFNRPEGSIILGAMVNDGEMLLSIADTGMGIPAHAISDIFQKFIRFHTIEGQALGTGLSLAICKEIVE